MPRPEVSPRHRALLGEICLRAQGLPTWALWVVWAVVRGLPKRRTPRW